MVSFRRVRRRMTSRDPQLRVLRAGMQSLRGCIGGDCDIVRKTIAARRVDGIGDESAWLSRIVLWMPLEQKRDRVEPGCGISRTDHVREHILSLRSWTQIALARRFSSPYPGATRWHSVRRRLNHLPRRVERRRAPCRRERRVGSGLSCSDDMHGT